jgi:hypothetical protein
LEDKLKNSEITTERNSRPKYEPPQIKVLTEEEVLSAFQVTAARTAMGWG